jgi:hypothetical protein
MASVKFRLNRPTQKESSILVRFYSKQTGPVDTSIGEKIPTKHWDGQRVSAKFKKDADRINKYLSKIEIELLDAWRNNKSLTGEELKGLVRGIVRGEDQPDQKKTVIDTVLKFIAQYEKEKDQRTVKKYRSLLRRLETFSKKYPLSFDKLDFNFYDKFKNFLYEQPNPGFREHRIDYSNNLECYLVSPCDAGDENIGLFDETVFKYLITLKTVCAWAETRGEQVHPAYKSWQIIKRDYQPISLTLDELRKIEGLHIPEKQLDIARDYLSLECRTGQRISDLKRFTHADISGTTWTFNQKKGSRLSTKRITLPLVGYCAPALAILHKYVFQLPRITEQHLNKNIKTICQRAGISEPTYIERWAGNKKIRITGPKHEFISTHTGRKTFITIALQFMNHQTVMSITGIRSYKTLKHYDGGSEIGTIEAGLRNIEDNISVLRKHA